MLEIKGKVRSGLGVKPEQLTLRAHLVHRNRQVATIAPVRITPVRANALAGALAEYGERMVGVGGSEVEERVGVGRFRPVVAMYRRAMRLREPVAA